MQFIRDLSDEQLTRMMAESDSFYVQRSFGNLAETAREAAGRPDFFWKRQESAIRSRIKAGQRPLPRLSLAWSCGLALILLSALFWRDVSPREPLTSQPDADQQLLISVERVVGSDLPASLEPAALLSDEIMAGNLPAQVKTAKAHREENSNEKE